MSTKKNIFIPIAVIVISAIFTIISLLVIITRGKNDRLIRAKLRIGAILLTLTATFGVISTSCPSTCYSSPCYNIPCYNAISATVVISSEEVSSDGVIYMDLTSDRIIKGTIEGAYSYSPDNFSFTVMKWGSDLSADVIQSGDIIALDGSTDSDIENFEISINDVTFYPYETPVVDLKIYGSKLSDIQSYQSCLQRFAIFIQP